MTSRNQLAIHIACALAALGTSLPTQAQLRHESCLGRSGNMESFPPAEAAPRNIFANGCIRGISDDRAAVLLPSAIEPIEYMPVNGSLQSHRWGFLDQDGRVAIQPRFEAVRDFRHGLAAVLWQGKWGFVDKDGQMVVSPRYDALQDMAEIGLAVATLEGRPRLINHQGDLVGAPLEDAIQTVHLSDGDPARATVRYRLEYRSGTGERRDGAMGITPHRTFGKNGLFIASNANGMYGVMDKSWNWIVEPVHHELEVMNEGGSAIGRGPTGWVMVTTEGKLIGADKRYASMRQIGRAFWAAMLPGYAGFEILDGDGEVVATLTPREAETTRLHGDTIIYDATGNTAALVPGREATILPGTELILKADADGFLLFADIAHSPAGLLTPTGIWLQATIDQKWMSAADRMAAWHGRAWIYNSEGTLLNVVDKDGKALLTPDAAEALQAHAIEPLPATAPDAPLALLGTPPCHCDETGKNAGLLLGDGTIVTAPSWTDVISLNALQDEASRKSAPAPLRYAAKTAEGMVLLDARGKSVGLAIQQHIGEFRHGYALIYGKGVARVTDVNGKTYDLPESFDARMAGPGVTRFVRTAADDAPWGLYDVVARKELASPQFRSIGDFRDGQAVASMGQDRVGVIDRQGMWIIPANHRDAKRVNAHLWLLSQRGDDAGTRPAAVFNSKGQALTTFEPRLEVTDLDNGSLDAGNGRRHWIISADGSQARDMADATYSWAGDWIGIQRANRQGYVDGSGAWKIAPSADTGTRFQGRPARALREDNETTQVIDANGKTLATLASGKWKWPEGSDLLIRHSSTDRRRTTDYADLDGNIVLSVDGTATAFAGGRAVTSLSNGEMRAVDDKGQFVGPVFDDLGPVGDGLAAASVGGRYGFVDMDGKFVIPAQYVAVSGFTYGRAVVSTASESMIIDPAGRALARVKMQCGVRTLHEPSGKRLWPERMPQDCNAR
ncbi:hypothetical protein CLM73_25795 [Achromobacter spanius]|uniref:WG repeat-containing protein n=2 Tax=Achromobacter spanius TaxID=217203 RepID=A0A2S0IDX8_9BURK|nr:hypothetical protein CLM73_25795 [Achromobacter spanius]